MAHRNYFRRNNLWILKLATYTKMEDHYSRYKIGNFFRMERIAKCSYFIFSPQNIKFYWFVMKLKKFLLSIWWYNRGLFPLGNKYFGVFVLNGLTHIVNSSQCFNLRSLWIVSTSTHFRTLNHTVVSVAQLVFNTCPPPPPPNSYHFTPLQKHVSSMVCKCLHWLRLFRPNILNLYNIHMYTLVNPNCSSHAFSVKSLNAILFHEYPRLRSRIVL